MTLIQELRRRNVFKMALFYLVASWLILQVGELLFDVLDVPEWGLRMLFGILVLGFPLILAIAWIYEVTPEGIKKQSQIDKEQSITHETGQRMNAMIIILLIGVLSLYAIDWAVYRDSNPLPDPVEEAVKGSGSITESAPAVIEPDPFTDSPADVSIAVLPFQNMSTDAANEFFADGIAEEILNLLAGVRDLEVASRTSSFAFKDKDMSIPDIAAALKVRYVLEGSVRKAGEQVRITAQLIDAETDRHLWSDTFDRTLEDIFAVQDEIAGAIGDALQVQLLGESGEMVTAETVDPEIYETFLEARFKMRQRNLQALEKAAAMLEDVVDAEPDFARGLLLLAEAYLLTFRYDDPEHFARKTRAAEALAGRAAALNPKLSGVPMIMGNIAMATDDARSAYIQYARAIELDPDEPRPHHWMAIILASSGHLERGLEEANEAIRLEPANANAHGWRSTIHMALGNAEAAVADARKQAELGNPVIGHYQAGNYLLSTAPAEAEREFELALAAGSGESNPFGQLISIAKGDGSLKQVLVEGIRENRFDDIYMALQSMLVLGMYETYVDLRLERRRLPMPNSSLMWRDEAAEMRRDPRFIQLMEREGYVDLWREIGPPPDCRAEGDSFVCGLTGDR